MEGQLDNRDTLKEQTRPHAWILPLFFLSGVSGLIYEILWVRMLTMFVGGSAFSVSIVLTVFMAGLALGSAIAARLIDRINRAESLVFLYGLLEIGISLCGILFPFVIKCLKPVYAALYNRLFESLLGYNLATSLLSIGLLIVPTTLMGATLPILCRYYIRRLQHVGTRTGWLYGLNTAGGAIGALLCGLWLIRAYGVNNSLATAVAINFLAGFVCILASKPAGAWSRLGKELKQAPPQKLKRRNASAAILIVLAVSGFCSMSYEVIWTKLLSLLVGPTTYSFTIVLFTFITGLALGSMIFGWVCDHTRRPFFWLIASQFAAAALALWVSQLLGNSQVFFAKLIFELKGDFLIMELAKGLSLFAFMLAPTLCLGAVFPIANKIHTDRIESVGSSVGTLYAVNTVGALLGSFCAGFFLVPFLGKAISLSGLTAFQACAALTACLVFPSKRPTALLLALPVALLLVAGSFHYPRWDRAALAKAKYHRFDDAGESLDRITLRQALLHGEESLKDQPPDPDQILFLDDGIGGFVAAGESVDSLGVTNRFISISGKIDASSYWDLATMTLLGQVPMLFHSNAVNVMVVGLASGITAGEMLHYPLKQLDILEISPEVVEACRFFGQWNNDVLSDPRARIIMQDARTHLALTDQMYDVIMSEPSNPWMAGVANLFTREYFIKVKQRLNPQGIFVQWIHTYQTDWDSFSMVVRTIDDVFPGSILIKTGISGSDYLIVCFKDPNARLDLDIAANNIVHAAKSTNMRLTKPEVLFPLIMNEKLNELGGQGPMHTDNHPLLEFAAPKHVYTGGTDIDVTILDRRSLSPTTEETIKATANVELQLAFTEFMASMNVRPFGLVNMSAATPEQKERYESIVRSFCEQNMVARYDSILNADDRRLCLEVHRDVMAHHAETLASDLPSEKARLGQAHYDLGNVYGGLEDYSRAVTCYTNALARLPGYEKPLRNLVLCYERLGQFEKALGVLSQLLENDPRSPDLLARIGANHLRLARTDEAIKYLNQSLAADPAYSPALVALGGIYGTKGDYERSIEFSLRALHADQTAIKAYQNMALALVRVSRFEEAAIYVEAGLMIDPANEVLLQMRPFMPAPHQPGDRERADSQTISN